MHPGDPDHPMRRSEKALDEVGEIEAILEASLVLRLAMCDASRPYIVPLNFAYRANRLYIHSAREGRKIDILRANPRVCFQVDADVGLIAPDDATKACGFTMRYRSVVGTGTAAIHEDASTITTGLDLIMARVSDRAFEYPEAALKKAAMIVVDVHEMSGKQSGMA